MKHGSSSPDEQFMATISHELRGPLHAILGLSEILVDSESLDDGDAQLADALHREAKRMRVLVDDVIAYGQFSSAAPSIKDAPFAPRTLVTSIVDRLRTQAEAADLRLLVDFDSNVPLRVLGDAVRFGQVVDNLVSNAIRYTEVGSVKVTLAADEHTMTVQVRDTGVGMSTADVETIFEPFVRVGNRTVQGTGLGLAIAKRISEAMDGTITVESTLGVGSTFVFASPCRPAKEAAVHRSDSSGGAMGTVLVVEDSEINRTLALKQLEILGLSGTAVESGEQALELLTDEAFDLVLMDWNLPGISGVDTAATIRSNELVAEDVPIIAMTANVLAGDREVCLAAGMNDHLAKPVALDDMRKMMEIWLADDSPERTRSSTGEQENTAGTTQAAICSAIDRLTEDLGDVDTVRVVVETYLGELAARAELITDLDTAPEESRRAAHTLRSTSALVGAERLAGLCHEFEQADQPDGGLRTAIAKEISTVEKHFAELLELGMAA